MKFPLALFALLLLCDAAMAADKEKTRVRPCPKGQVATTSKITGDQHCFVPTPFVSAPAQPAKGGTVTAPTPVLKTK
jgi:hypothetical protein